MAVDQSSNWDNVGTEPPVGEAIYFVSEQPFADYDNYFNYSVAKDIENIIAEFSDYFKKDGSVMMTGDLIKRSGDSNILGLYGGENHAARLTLAGKDSDGAIYFHVPNAAKNATVIPFYVPGISDSPFVHFSYGIKTDTIEEKTTTAGVTIDSCLIKDGKVADSEKIGGQTGEEISLGSIPLAIYTSQSVTGTTHTELKMINNTNNLFFFIYDRPTAPSAWTLKGKLCALLNRAGDAGTAYVEIYSETDSSQVVAVNTTVNEYYTKRSSLFTLPANNKQLSVRIWGSGGSVTSVIEGIWVEFIAVKD